MVLASATGCSEISRNLAAQGTPTPVGTNANIAFMGDSITAFWSLPKSNLGVSGNTTGQMLARFPLDVPGHGYKAFVFLGGTNDMRYTDKPIQQEVATAIGNIEQMAAMAESENLLVVLCTIPPIANSGERVVPLNDAIESYASAHQYLVVDYYTPMIGHPEYFKDALHPDAKGYAVMQTALTQVLPLSY